MWTYSISSPRTLRALEALSPDPADMPAGTVLLRPLAGAICGSDMAFYRGRVSPFHDPELARASAIPGFSLHEIVGEVAACPGGEFEPGTVVVGWANGCDALAEWVVTAASSVVEVPEGLRPTRAVSLQPLACVVEMVSRLPRVEGATVAIAGLGPIGLLFAHALKDAGAAHVIGIDPVDRTGAAERFGLDATVRSTVEAWRMNLADDERPDIVVEAVGHQVGTLAECLRATAPGGTTFYFGVPDDMVYPVPLDHMFRNSIALLTGNVRNHRAALEQAVAYVARHPALLDDLVSHELGIHDASAAYAIADTVAPDRLKVVLDFA